MFVSVQHASLTHECVINRFLSTETVNQLRWSIHEMAHWWLLLKPDELLWLLINTHLHKYTHYIHKYIRTCLLYCINYFQIHTPTVVQGGGGGRGWNPSPEFLTSCIVTVFRNDFTFSRKPLLFLTRWGIFYGCWRCWRAVTNNGRHLGFHQELEIRLKPREMVIFCALHEKITHK